MRASSDVKAASIAARQHGLITRAQAIECGLTPAEIKGRLRSSRWERIHPSVYRFAGSRRTWEQSVLAACLSAGAEAAASHVTAGVLWRMVAPRRSRVEISVPYGCGARTTGILIHRTRLPLRPVARIRGIPVTSPHRTLIDLASVLDGSTLEEGLDEAIRRGLITPSSMGEVLEGLGTSGLRGLAILRRLVAVRYTRRGNPDGRFETQMVQILRNAGLPEPELQYEIRRDGHLIARVDVCYPDQHVVIELDGYEKHSSRQAFDYDRIRQNALIEAGYLVLRFTWTDRRRPRYVTDTVRRVLLDRRHPEVVSI